jgi:hypothetical protein
MIFLGVTTKQTLLISNAVPSTSLQKKNSEMEMEMVGAAATAATPVNRGPVQVNLRAKVSSFTVRTTDSLETGQLIGKAGSDGGAVDMAASLFASPAHGHVCMVCTQCKGVYCCPRCFVSYCSLKCFRTHNNDCTEEFAKTKIADVFHLESRAKEDSPDQILQTELQQRKTDSNADKPSDSSSHSQIISREQRELLDSLAACQLEVDAPDAEPDHDLPVQDRSSHSKVTLMRATNIKLDSLWWESDDENKSRQVRLIESLTSNTALLRSLWSNQPAKSPSPNLGYHVLALLYGYVMTMRSFDGDYINRVPEFMATMNSSTPVFATTFKPQTVTHSIELCIQHRSAIRGGSIISRKTIKQTVSDVMCLTKQPSHVLYVLVQIWLLAYCELNSATHADDVGNTGSLGDTRITLTDVRLFCGFPSLDTEKANMNRIHEAVRADSSGQFVNVDDVRSMFTKEEVTYIAAAQSIPTICSLLTDYHNIFTCSKSAVLKRTPSLLPSPRQTKYVSELDTMARKCYFILLVVLQNDSLSRQLHVMLSAYHQECLAT